MTLKEILSLHASKYPEMSPTDAVKLIYQNEFGPGHLIRNRENAFEYLKAEYDRADSTAGCLYEHIGNGLVRVNLAGFKARGLDLSALFDAFCKSAETVKGNVESLKEKLEILKELTEEGTFKFSVSELCDYLCAYEAAGYPMVSHSEVYRQHYHPSYRIVLEKFLNI